MTKKETDNIIKKIKIAMIESGFNQVSLAKKMGKTHSAINKMLNGGSTITMENLEKIATLTKRPINYFFDNSTDVKGNQNIVGKNITVSPNVEKDIALMRVKIEALESKIENLELKYNLLKKGK
ncbi:helix-turn-helix domain-containing protein [Candidatus Avelusimicrobium fimicolum]|jgi:transcriptional regulator with XRE-family HTH domain|uniref:helix-turn-helix domain-containing protein n=1 Tax=Candidatus Avelusimicrobium fimicolum TaxID=3416216 RepID=UPI003D0E505F